MSEDSFFKEILVGPYTIRLIIQEQIPYVEFEKQLFPHVWLLVQQLPVLSHINYLKEFAQISNFLWKGTQFQFIENIVDYQTFYHRQIALEKQCPSDVFPYRLTDYKIFDVSVMHDPQLEKEKLLYFVYQTATALPYRVVCPFPYISHSTLVHYQVLPIKKETSFS